MVEILLIEDSTDLAAVIQRELEAAGYHVRIAADGETGLLLFQQNTPDLVLLDWMLPGIDGLEVLRRVQNESAVPVLMLTARSGEADRVIGLEMGADDYLSKPFSMRELQARIHAVLRRTERVQQMLQEDRLPASRRIEWCGITIDPQSFQADLNGSSLELTRTEFELLSLFLRNPGRVFSRSYLLETVWDQTYIEGDRSVDNTILRLRKKLGSLGESIETVWGVGYRLQRNR